MLNPKYLIMKNISKYFILGAGLSIILVSCLDKKKKNELLGSWKVADLKTTDSSADMGLLLMAIVGTSPDSMRLEKDSLKVVMHSKDSVFTEAMKYTRKHDSIWVHNAGGTIEPIGIQWEGDTLLLAGNGYTYYLVR